MAQARRRRGSGREGPGGTLGKGKREKRVLRLEGQPPGREPFWVQRPERSKGNSSSWGCAGAPLVELGPGVHAGRVLYPPDSTFDVDEQFVTVRDAGALAHHGTTSFDLGHVGTVASAFNAWRDLLGGAPAGAAAKPAAELDNSWTHRGSDVTVRTYHGEHESRQEHVSAAWCLCPPRTGRSIRATLEPATWDPTGDPEILPPASTSSVCITENRLTFLIAGTTKKQKAGVAQARAGLGYFHFGGCGPRVAPRSTDRCVCLRLRACAGPARAPALPQPGGGRGGARDAPRPGDNDLDTCRFAQPLLAGSSARIDERRPKDGRDQRPGRQVMNRLAPPPTVKGTDANEGTGRSSATSPQGLPDR